MSKAPSERTQLANARREIKDLVMRLQSATQALAEYRARSTRAEQSVAEWKDRFDRLLDFRKVIEGTTQGKLPEQSK